MSVANVFYVSPECDDPFLREAMFDGPGWYWWTVNMRQNGLVEGPYATAIEAHRAATPDDWNTADRQREHDAADVSLGLVFGDEYGMIVSSSDRLNVRHDFLRAFRDTGCTASQYRDRVGKGNLAEYAKKLRRP